MAKTEELRTLNDAPFGPEETSEEQLGYAPEAFTLPTTGRGTEPPVPQQSLDVSHESPAGDLPPYIAPGDERRQAALAPVAPPAGVQVAGQPIPGQEAILIHHVYETIDRAAQTAVTRKQNVSGTPAILVGKNDRRRKLTIQNNNSSLAITVGMDDTITAAGPSGFDIVAGAAMDFYHRDWMWVVCAAGSTGTCQIVETMNEISSTQLPRVDRNPTNVRANP